MSISNPRGIEPNLEPLAYLIEGKLLRGDVLQANTVLGSDQYKAVVTVVNLSSSNYQHLACAQAVIRQLCIAEEFRPLIATSLHEQNAHVGSDRCYELVRSRC